MIEIYTVKQLKEALKNVPDNTKLQLWSDTGVDQCDDGIIVIEKAFKFEDSFIIYANIREYNEEE